MKNSFPCLCNKQITKKVSKCEKIRFQSIIVVNIVHHSDLRGLSRSYCDSHFDSVVVLISIEYGFLSLHLQTNWLYGFVKFHSLERFKCAETRDATAPDRIPSESFIAALKFTRLTELASSSLPRSTSQLRALRRFNKNSPNKNDEHHQRYHQMNRWSLWSEKQLRKYDNDEIIERKLTPIFICDRMGVGRGRSLEDESFVNWSIKIARRGPQQKAAHEILENTRFIMIR